MKGKHVLIALIVLLAGYGIYSGRKDVDVAKRMQAGWEEGDLEILVEKCIADSKETAVDYPAETREYCNCSSEQIQNSFSKQAFLQISQQNIAQQTNVLLPAFRACLEAYQIKLKKAGRGE